MAGIAAISHGVPQGGSSGYLRLSLHRKLLLGLLQTRAVDWQAVSAAQVRAASPDEGNHLECFPRSWSAREISLVIFSRPDWGLLVSSFACMWSVLGAKGGPALRAQLEGLAETGELVARARGLAVTLGFAPTATALCESLGPPTPSASRGLSSGAQSDKRAAARSGQTSASRKRLRAS